MTRSQSDTSSLGSTGTILNAVPLPGFILPQPKSTHPKLGPEKFWSKRILFYNCKELWSKHFQFSIPSDSDFVCITSSGPELLVTRSHSSSLKVIRDHPEVIKGQKSDSNPSAAFETRLNQITIVSKMIQFP